MARPLFASYSGFLFKLHRDSDSATKNIGMTNGLADTVAASSFCSGTTCRIVTLYDQTSYHLDAIDKNRNGDVPVPPVYLTMQAGGKTIPYWGKGYLEAGSRADSSLGNGAMPVGSVPVTEYELVGPATGPSTCCFDFGEAETTISDTGKGHMFAVMLTPDALCIDVENGGLCG
jgi:non-reducing end alpha-L-arabinofuranosidase